MKFSPRFVEAFAYMYELHWEQCRKDSGIPYITHLMAVSALVGEYGGTEAQCIAALLHDAVEDQGGLQVAQDIQARFGEEVARFVDICSDSYSHPKPPWEDRKKAHIEETRVADAEAKLILAADKLHNARSIVADLSTQGERLWERFNGKKSGTLWYYRKMLSALEEGWEAPILIELKACVLRMHALAGVAYSP